MNPNGDGPAPGHGVYGISVAAELSGTAVQSLRLYERHGLLAPARSDGGTRRYSGDDLDRIRRITVLLAAGVNLAGIGRILPLEDDNAALVRTVAALEHAAATAKKPRTAHNTGAASGRDVSP